jgi:endonuclease/exonuclease/phosphatase family metal-dependent hydrolase
MVLAMSMEVLTWNLRESMAQAEEMPVIVDTLLRRRPDVAVLPDSHSLENELHGSEETVLNRGLERLHDAGYHLWVVPYGPGDNWRHDRNLIAASRLPAEGRTVRLGPRYGIELLLEDEETGSPVQLVGGHWDDRRTDTRLRQSADYVYSLRRPDAANILAGDLNSFRSRLWGSAALGLAGVLAPQERLRSVIGRQHQMAGGEALDRLEADGLTDVNYLHRPTHVLGADPDHILVSSKVAVERVWVGPWSPASDHRPLSAVVRIDGTPLAGS